MTFTPEIYEQARDGARRSAAKIVPLTLSILRLAKIRTVMDVGCGEGWFAREFAARGARVLGLDATVEEYQEVVNAAAHEGVGGGIVYFLRADLTAPGWSKWQADVDLAVCLEVAEHLPESAAAGLVAELTAAAPIVLFSAAIPGQGGHGHLNEQWPRWWSSLFAAQGFTLSGGLRSLIWDDDEIEPWYRQNLMLAVKRTVPAFVTEPALLYGPERLGMDPLSLVHPVVWEHRRQRP